MSNEKVKNFEKVYNRKIERNKIKKVYKTNRIRNIWHQLQGKTYYSHINREKVRG